eukprot:5390715-Pyramimonas_sp.AAC.2
MGTQPWSRARWPRRGSPACPKALSLAALGEEDPWPNKPPCACGNAWPEPGGLAPVLAILTVVERYGEDRGELAQVLHRLELPGQRGVRVLDHEVDPVVHAVDRQLDRHQHQVGASPDRLALVEREARYAQQVPQRAQGRRSCP